MARYKLEKAKRKRACSCCHKVILPNFYHLAYYYNVDFYIPSKRKEIIVSRRRNLCPVCACKSLYRQSSLFVRLLAKLLYNNTVAYYSIQNYSAGLYILILLLLKLS